MEADPHRRRARRGQPAADADRVVRLRAEFAGQIQLRPALRQRDAHDQPQRARHAGGGDLRADLRQFVGAVENEIAHAVPLPRLADRAARLDRVHEVDRPPPGTCRGPDGSPATMRSRNAARRRPTAPAAPPDRDCTSRHTAHRRESLATKSRAVCGDHGRAQAMHRLLRASGGDHLIHRRDGGLDRQRTDGAAAKQQNGDEQQQTSRESSRNKPDARQTRPR